MAYEPNSKKVAPMPVFIRRLAVSVLIALALTGVSLAIGMEGYHALEHMPWLDSFLNASMILSGMGEIDPLKTEGGKLFAGIYAIYSGLWVVASMGIILAPVFHRVLHRFHAEKD